MRPYYSILLVLLAVHLRAELADEVTAAGALLRTGRWPEAKTAFEKILAHAPDEPEANHIIGLMAADAGQWEKALRHAKIAVTADPASARFQWGWASANGLAALNAGYLSRLGYAKICLAAYRRAVELDPKTLRYRWALLNFYQQAPGIAGGDRSKALAEAAEIGRLDAEEGRQAFAQIYLAEKNYDAAFRPYDEALRARPDDFMLLYQFGRLTLRADRRVDEGLAAFRRCLALPRPEGKDVPTPANLHWRLGNARERMRDPAQARAEYEEALRLDPEFRPAHQALEKLKSRKETGK